MSYKVPGLQRYGFSDSAKNVSQFPGLNTWKENQAHVQGCGTLLRCALPGMTLGKSEKTPVLQQNSQHCKLATKQVPGRSVLLISSKVLF